MTDAELAILSIVAEGPINAHAIQTIIDQRGLRAWTNIGVSSIYYVLEKLERQGLLESSGTEQQEASSRRQYHITPAGYGVLQTSVADLLSTPREHNQGFELGLANLHVLDARQIRGALTTYRHELETRLTQTRSRRDHLQIQQVPFNVIAMFERQAALLEAELAWVNAFIAAWEAHTPAEIPLPPVEPDEIPRMKQVILPHEPDSPHRAPTRPLTYPVDQKPSDREAATDNLNVLNNIHDTRPSMPTPPDLHLDDTDEPDSTGP